MSRPAIILKLILGLLWVIIHLTISLFNLWSLLIYNLQCYLISSGLLRKYQYLHLDRLNYLAIVVDSKEAKNTVKIRQLLSWLSTMGVKHICLYDIEGKAMSSSFEFLGYGFQSKIYLCLLIYLYDQSICSFCVHGHGFIINQVTLSNNTGLLQYLGIGTQALTKTSCPVAHMHRLLM